MSFTPQIIELADGLKCVLLEDYKKLEQERDEARQQIAKLLNKLDQLYRDVEIDKLKEGAK
jgi:predicted outer membrane protein